MNEDFLAKQYLLEHTCDKCNHCGIHTFYKKDFPRDIYNESVCKNPIKPDKLPEENTCDYWSPIEDKFDWSDFLINNTKVVYNNINYSLLRETGSMKNLGVSLIGENGGEIIIE